MKLVTRNQVFQKNNDLAKLIRGFQKDLYDDEYDYLERDEIFDILEFQLDEIVYESFVIEIENSEIETYTKILSEKLVKLMEFLKISELILISHLKLDFFVNIEHVEDYDEVIYRYKKLSEIIGSKFYNEAIKIKKDEVEIFLEIFFWIGQGNQGSEFVFWADDNGRFCFYICKYGKLHFIDFTNGNLISNISLKEIGFNELEGKCSQGVMLNI